MVLDESVGPVTKLDRPFDLEALKAVLGEMPDSALAAKLGISRRSLSRYEHSGISPDLADLFACRVGLHPKEVWQDWGAHPLGQTISRVSQGETEDGVADRRFVFSALEPWLVHVDAERIISAIKPANPMLAKALASGEIGALAERLARHLKVSIDTARQGLASPHLAIRLAKACGLSPQRVLYPMTKTEIAHRLGVSEQEVDRLRHTPLTRAQAIEVAERLGLNPRRVWPVIAEDERVIVEQQSERAWVRTSPLSPNTPMLASRISVRLAQGGSATAKELADAMDVDLDVIQQHLDWLLQERRVTCRAGVYSCPSRPKKKTGAVIQSVWETLCSQPDRWFTPTELGKILGKARGAMEYSAKALTNQGKVEMAQDPIRFRAIAEAVMEQGAEVV